MKPTRLRQLLNLKTQLAATSHSRGQFWHFSRTDSYAVVWLAEVQPGNQQGEYYLTDVVALAVNDGVGVQGILVKNESEVIGVNDRLQLALVERIAQRQHTDELMRQGVTFADPDRVDIRGSLSCGTDCFIDVNTVFIGDVRLEPGVFIGPSVVVESSHLELVYK